ncbi:Formin-like protein 11 [Linum perenne]
MASCSCAHILLLIILMCSLADAEKQIQRISGVDESEGQTVIMLQKFRDLLGLPWIQHFRSSPSSENWAPAPAPAPEAAPMVPFRMHSHHHISPSPLPEVEERAARSSKGKFRRILMVVIVSAAGVAALVVCAFLLIWAFWGKFKKQQHRRGSVGKKRRSRGHKVSLNPGLDFLYLNSMCRDSELETSGLKQNAETLKPHSYRSSPKCVVGDDKEKVEMVESSVSSSSTRDITSVDGYAEEPKIVRIECHSSLSEEELFHSFGGSHSPSIRLSNASAGSVSEPSALESNGSLVRLPAHSSSHETALDRNARFITTPPPPPPPPLPHLPRISPPIETSWRSKKSTSTFPDLSSPRGLITYSSSGKKALPPPPQKSQSGIPPPPPSQLAQRTPLGKDGAPLPKLKPLHWDKVRAPPDQRMVWDKIRSNSFELDEEMIESLFGYNMRSTPKEDDPNSCKTPSPSKHVLDPKRLQNLTILSKALNSTADEVCDSLMRGDGLGLQQLEALARMAPTNEEQSKLHEYNGNINELGSAERFVKTLLTIPFAFDRVEAMLFRETFEDEVIHLRNSFSMLEEACKELRSSRLFLKLLETVLKTGNRMNVGTIRGGAIAFKLDALLKLSDVKGTDNKTTLLHFVVQEICRTDGVRPSETIIGTTINQQKKSDHEKEENYGILGLDLVSGLSAELHNVKKTATVDLDVLATSVSNLSSGIAKVNRLIRNQIQPCGEFVSLMKGFVRRAERDLKEVKGEEDRVMSMVREVTEYFHGNVGRDEANPLRIFVIVRDFLGMLDHVCRELRSSKMIPPLCSSNPFR